MTPEELQSNKKIRSLIFFSTFVIFLLFFLLRMGFEAGGNRDLPTQKATISEKSKRGKIVTADGFTISQSVKLYKASIFAPGIKKGKRELFINLFSIYSSLSKDYIKRRLGRFDSNVVLSYNINPTTAKYLKELSRKLYTMGVYKRIHYQNGGSITYKLEIEESGESREFFYRDTLTPAVGHMTKVNDQGYTRPQGLKGLEKQYQEQLNDGQDGFIRGKRDLHGDIVFDGDSIRKRTRDGYNLKLHINLKLQKRVEMVLDAYKKELKAKEITAVVMDSTTGSVYAFASSNRYDPSNIKQNQISFLNPTATEHLYEPGSVIKPITFTLLLETDKVNPLELINTENGRYRLNGYLITDEHKNDWLSAQNVITYSSNIGMAKLAQRLEGYELYDGFKRFGLTRQSGIDLPYERVGGIQEVAQLNSPVYKATSAYGYGMSVNLIQLLKAHSAFNNGGHLVTPHLVASMTRGNKTYHQKPSREQVITSATAARMNNILQRVAKKGSANRALIEGLEIGGKTGTAHISVEGTYENRYNSTFIGFVNDVKNRYNIAVLTHMPQKKYHHFASLTSVPVFKAVAEKMIELDMLRPKKDEGE